MNTTKPKSYWIKLAAFLVFLVVFALLPLWGSEYLVSIFILVFLYMALAQMWNLLSGYAGLVSLGQQVFVGLGGYTLAMMTQKYDFPIWASIVVGVVICVVFAGIISFPIFKMSGVYFTIGTWIVAEALMVFFTNWAFVNYAIGYNITVAYRLPTEYLYWAALAIGVASVAIVYGLLRSRLGLALMSMRDNTSAAEVRGVQLYRSKLLCFLLTAGFTAIIGVVLFLNSVNVKPSSAFSIDWTISMVFMVVIGGMGTIEGPIVGALIYIVLRQYLYNFPGISMVILGALAVAIILLAPKGIVGALHDKFGFEIFSVRRVCRTKPRETLSIGEVLGAGAGAGEKP